MDPETTRFASTPLGNTLGNELGVIYIGLPRLSTTSVLTRLSYTGTFTITLGGYLPFVTYSPSILSTDRRSSFLKLSRIASSERFLPNHLTLFSNADAIIFSSRSSIKLYSLARSSLPAARSLPYGSAPVREPIREYDLLSFCSDSRILIPPGSFMRGRRSCRFCPEYLILMLGLRPFLA